MIRLFVFLLIGYLIYRIFKLFTLALNKKSDAKDKTKNTFQQKHKDDIIDTSFEELDKKDSE